MPAPAQSHRGRPQPQLMTLYALMLAACLLTGIPKAQAGTPVEVPPSSNPGTRSLCVFSITGAQGELWNRMQDYALAARAHGVSIELRPYTREQIAAEDLKAGLCDAVLITGIRARQFNGYTGSIDAIGGLPGYDALHLLLQVLARPESAAPMRNGPYEVAGLLPLGAAWLFLNDRRINSLEKMAGKRLAVLDYDRAQLLMADRIGAIPVHADVTSFAGKFNNGIVDVVAAPAAAYLPLELYRGVGTRGVILKLPVAQLTFQLLVRHERFPAGFGQASREILLGLFETTLNNVRAAEEDLLFFYPPPDRDRTRYRQLLQESRIALAQEGIYDPRMMRLMKKVRCRLEPAAAECSDNREMSP